MPRLYVAETLRPAIENQACQPRKLTSGGLYFDNLEQTLLMPNSCPSLRELKILNGGLCASNWDEATVLTRHSSLWAARYDSPRWRLQLKHLCLCGLERLVISRINFAG